jgi:hypothetical protein
MRAGTEALELFNLRDDPAEMHNLAAAHPEKVKELREHLAVYEKQAVTPKNLVPSKRPAGAEPE